MDRWTCPNCKRVFGRKNQSHLTCEPALTIDEYFAEANPFERPIFEVVNAHLSTLEGVIIDPIGVGILLKNGPLFAELRPRNGLHRDEDHGGGDGMVPDDIDDPFL